MEEHDIHRMADDGCPHDHPTSDQKPVTPEQRALAAAFSEFFGGTQKFPRS